MKNVLIFIFIISTGLLFGQHSYRFESHLIKVNERKYPEVNNFIFDLDKPSIVYDNLPSGYPFKWTDLKQKESYSISAIEADVSPSNYDSGYFKKYGLLKYIIYYSFETKTITKIVEIQVNYYNKKSVIKEYLAQETDKSISKVDDYLRLLKKTVDAGTLYQFKDPVHNGYIDTKKSNDGRFITQSFKLRDLDRLMVVKDSNTNSIKKILFIIGPDIIDDQVYFNTDKSILYYLNQNLNTIEYDKKWSAKSLTLEHTKESNGLGILIITQL